VWVTHRSGLIVPPARQGDLESRRAQDSETLKVLVFNSSHCSINPGNDPKICDREMKHTCFLLPTRNSSARNFKFFPQVVDGGSKEGKAKSGSLGALPASSLASFESRVFIEN